MKLNFALEGRYKLTVRDAKTLAVNHETPWFENVITNGGLNQLGTGGGMAGCAVGSGTTPEQPTDTSLSATIARTATILSTTYPSSTVEPYYFSALRTFRFAEGAAAGNISEVGILYNNASPFPLFSRSLVKDEDGDPVTITVQPNEILDVSYECRTYPMISDSTAGPFLVNGENYMLTIRGGRVSAGGATYSGLPISGSGATYVVNCFAGPIGAITGTPSGASAGAGNLPPQTYVNNSLVRKFIATVSISQGNVTGGFINSIWLTPLSSPSLPEFQIGFDKPFPKNNTITFSFTFEFSWARKT